MIFADGEEQTEAARKAIERGAAEPPGKVVTEIEPAATFWRAEEYHQCYLQKRSERGGMFSSLLGGH